MSQDVETPSQGAEPAPVDAESAEPSPPPPRRPVPTRRGAWLLLVGALGLAGYLTYGPSSPRDNTVRFVLGDAAPTVRAVDVRYLDGDEVLREAAFQYPGGAPRIVSHEVRAKAGDYRVEVHVGTDKGMKSFEKTLRLEGGATQVDLVPSLVR